MLYFVQHPARLLRWNYLLILFSHSYSFYLFLSLYSFELESQETSHKSGSVLYHMLLFRLRLTFFRYPPQFRRALHPPREPGAIGCPE